MDYVWSIMGYESCSKVAAQYPEATKVVNDFLSNIKEGEKYKPGCGGVHKHNDRRVKRLTKKAKIVTYIRNSVESNGFSLEIERMLLEKAKEQVDNNNDRHLQIEKGNTQITVIVPPFCF